MKKISFIFLSLMLAAGILSGCSTLSSSENDQRPLRIVTTIFPEYDWVRQILGDQADHAELTILLDDGVDLHSFQPTAKDIATISNCDLFLYTGGESDSWVEDALASVTNQDLVAMNLMEVLGDGVKEEVVVEGMQEEDPHQEDQHEDSESEHAHQDEHIWLSLKHAALFCRAIADTLGTIDPAHQETYRENADAYIQRLEDLDAQYKTVVDNASTRTLLFADRFPFRYLADDYGIAYYAAFSGCSAETEASFETVAFLSGKVEELSLPCVLTIEGATHNIAQTVVESTSSKNQKILVLDSMQSVTAADLAQGATYLGIMEKNLETLKIALN